LVWGAACTSPSVSCLARSQRVTIQDVADALGISRSAASRRLGRAEAFGFVKNVQVLKAGPKVYETNERMPQDAGVLPHPDELS
jgi:predicted ArsR family transcriptional regulator